jgi:hypothetical protein
MTLATIRLLLILFAACGLVIAQNSSVQGQATDTSGAAVPNASVTLTNLETGVALKYTTNQEGLYVAPSLNPGRYKLDVAAPGFATQAVSEFRLEVGQSARFNFELNPGAVIESVQVSAAAVLLNTDTSEVGQVIDSKRITEMPLNGRNYLQLAQFTTGVLPGGNTNQGSRAREEGAFSAVGMQIAQNNVLLDGNDNSSRTSGGPLGFEAQAVKPPVDAVAEFKVVTNNMSAEYGYRAGAKVLVNTRAGTNEFHGSLYHFLRNDALDATNFFANRSGAGKPTYKQNQFGGTLGGAIVKNRTFFFGSYQGTRIRLGQSFISTVPSRDIVERGDFSQQPAIRRNIFDPLTLSGTGANAVRQPFPGNIIPKNRWDPVVARFIGLYPAPNIPGREHLTENYFFSPTDSNDADQYDVRGDHNFSQNHRFFARYSLRDQFRYENGPLPAPATGGLGQTVDLKGHNVVGNLSSTLSPAVFNELRFGFSKFDTRFDILDTENLNTQFGIKGAPGETFGDGLDHGWTRFTPSGYREIGSRSFWPNVNNLANYMITDSALWQKGKHTLKFGGEYRHLNIYRDASRFRRGQFAFSGQFTAERPNVGTSRGSSGNGLADMLLGWVSGGSYGNNQGENVNAPYTGFFIQDDWRIRRNLTLNIGLRYEVFFPGTFPDPERQTVSRYLLEGINVATAADERIVFPASGSDCGCRVDKNNWAPRLGLAWSATEKTVIRAGAGTFYGEPNSLSTEGANFRSGLPRQVEISIQQNFETTNTFVQAGFPPFVVSSDLPRGSQINVFPDFRENLTAYQWFFDVQRTLPFDMLVTAGYMGTKGTFLATQRNINLPITPNATVAANQRLIRPQFNAVTLHENGLNSNYHALTAKVEKRFSKGLTFLSSFTWSKNMDYGNEDLLDGGQGAATPYNLSLERGLSTLHRSLAYVVSGVYELPFGKGRSYLTSGPASWVFGGWQVGGLVSLLSGLPIGHSINVNNQNLGGSVRGDWVRNPNLPSSERSIDRWFDTGFVVPSAPGVLSNAGRNLIIGPGRKNLDVMIGRDFLMPFEGHRLQFRFESFNFTNTPNFGPPNASVGTPSAGLITVAEDPRRIQFALKYLF